MAAHACLTGSSSGLSCNPIAVLPTAIAPDDTSITSLPEFLRSTNVLTSFSIFLKFNLPVSLCIKEDEPIFITILFLLRISSLALILIPRSL